MLHTLLAEAFLRQQRMSEAERSLEQAMSYDSGNSRLWVNVGRLNNLLNKHLQAEAALKKALALDPRNSLAWFHLGMLYLDQDLEDKALTHLRKGLEVSSGDALASLTVAQIYLRKNNRGEAKRFAKLGLQQKKMTNEIYSSLTSILELNERAKESYKPVIPASRS